jgi:HK97 family phage prohead protease
MSIEFRTGVAELRAVGEDGMTFEGIAAVYDSPSAEGTNPEVVKPGAFSRSLAASQRGEWDIKAYADHNPERLLGTTKSGTLELTDTAEGLRARIKLNPDISYHRDLAAIVKTMGKSLGLSFGFFSTAANRVNDQGVRELRDVKLVEVSALTGLAPYYPATIATVAVRSLAETAGIDVAELGQALAALAAGTATPDQARLITTAVASIIAEDGIESAEDQMESEDLAAATAEVIGAIEPQSDAPAMASVPRSIREKEMDLARRAVK